MQQRAAWRLGLNAEEAGSCRATSNLLFSGLAHGLHSQLQAQRDASQRMVAVEHDMFWVDLGHGVQGRAGGIGVAALGQCHAVEGHAFFNFGGEECAGFQKQQLVVEVTESVLGFEVQRQRGTGAMALQGLFDAGQKIITAHQKLHGFIEYVEFFAQGVFQGPGQCDHTLLGNFHRRIVAV